MKKYVAGMYLRLSDEDRDKSNALDNSESIENQERICRQWLSAHPEVTLYDVYIDDGYSGMDYERQGYQRLKNDINNGHINMILAKSLSRLGREQVETLILFKREFVLKDIRFVGVADGTDYNGPTPDDGVSLPFKIMMNDYYCRNVSIDIRASLKEKREAGQFVGSFASYGYVKDPNDKNHLLIDPYPASVVKRIFSLFLYGNNIKYIVQVLNDEGILCPSEYKWQVQNLKYHANKLGSTNYWTYHTVKKILKHPMYTGCMVQHTKEKIAYNINKYRLLPKSEWVIVPGTHEAIISQEEFDRVQQLIAVRTREVKAKNLSPYAGVIFCGDCGRAMSKQQYHGSKGFRYRCGTYARIGKRYCTEHAIYTYQLDEMIMYEVSKVLETLSDAEIDAIRCNSEQNNRSVEQRNINHLLKRMQELDEEKREMLRLLSKKTLSEKDFFVYNEEYTKEMDLLQKQLAEAQQRQCNADEKLKAYEKFVNQFLQYKEVNEVTRELIVNLVERITVFENQKVQIRFLFKNPFLN